MNLLVCLLGQVEVSRDLLNQRTRSWGGFDTTDTLLVLGFIFFVVVALFSWAYFIRKRPTEQYGSHALVRPKPRRRHRSRHSRWGSAPSDSARRTRVRRRRRRRSQERLPRNPTLGETGGLPPIRAEEPEEPPPAPSQA